MVRLKALKRTGFTAILAAILMVAAACSNNAKEGSSSSSAAPSSPAAAESSAPAASDVDKTPVEIKIATWVPADSPEWHKISDAFTAKYPWITVKWYFVSDATMIENVTQTIASGDPYDIFWNPTFYDVVSSGLAENLTPFIDKDEEFKSYQFNPGILEAFQYQGQQYGLSRGNDTFLFIYNKDILDKYGIEPPTNDWSWDDLAEKAKAATHPDDKVWGISSSPLMAMYAGADIAASNGHTDHIMDLNGDLKTTFTYMGNDKNVMADRQFMMDWVSKDGIMLNDKSAGAAGIQGDGFATGNAAFFYGVSPALPSFKQQFNFNWGIAPTPKGSVKQVGTSFNNPMFLAKASKHKEQAFQFMKFWAASVEGQKILMDIGGSLPNSSSPEIVDYFNGMDTYQGLNVDALLYALKIAEVDPTIYMPGGSELVKANQGWAGDPYQNGGSAYDYFPTVTDKVNQAIQDAIASAK